MVVSMGLSTRNGKLMIALAGRNDMALKIAQQGDEKLIVIGADGSKIHFVRVHLNGTLDTSFGDNGVVVTTLGGRYLVSAAAIQPDENGSSWVPTST
jgi:hypothetical protein